MNFLTTIYKKHMFCVRKKRCLREIFLLHTKKTLLREMFALLNDVANDAESTQISKITSSLLV